jgi:hypothetical protein
MAKTGPTMTNRNPHTGAIVHAGPKCRAFLKIGREPREQVSDGRRSTDAPAVFGPSNVA